VGRKDPDALPLVKNLQANEATQRNSLTQSSHEDAVPDSQFLRDGRNEPFECTSTSCISIVIPNAELMFGTINADTEEVQHASSMSISES